MFLIFGGQAFYGSGGGNDLIGKDNDEKIAIKEAEAMLGQYAVSEINDWSDDRNDDEMLQIEWTHVLNGETGDIIAKFGKDGYGLNKPAIEIRPKRGSI